MLPESRPVFRPFNYIFLIFTNKQMEQGNKQTSAKKQVNARNLLGHVGRLVSVADKPLLAIHQPRDVRDHQEAGRDYHGRNLVCLLVYLFIFIYLYLYICIFAIIVAKTWWESR